MSQINFVFACELEPGDKILSGQEFNVGQGRVLEPTPLRLGRDYVVDNVVPIEDGIVRVNLRNVRLHLLVSRGRVVRCA